MSLSYTIFAVSWFACHSEATLAVDIVAPVTVSPVASQVADAIDVGFAVFPFSICTAVPVCAVPPVNFLISYRLLVAAAVHVKKEIASIFCIFIFFTA